MDIARTRVITANRRAIKVCYTKISELVAGAGFEPTTFRG
jgi:hypothetical protein